MWHLTSEMGHVTCDIWHMEGGENFYYLIWLGIGGILQILNKKKINIFANEVVLPLLSQEEIVLLVLEPKLQY